MFRKLTIGLVAAASLSAMALASTEASARSFGGRGFARAGGFGGGHHHFVGGRGFHGGGFHRGGGFGRGLGVGLALDLIGTAAIAASTCRQAVTAGGRLVTIC